MKTNKELFIEAFPNIGIRPDDLNTYSHELWQGFEVSCEIKDKSCIEAIRKNIKHTNKIIEEKDARIQELLKIGFQEGDKLSDLMIQRDELAKLVSQKNKEIESLKDEIAQLKQEDKDMCDYVNKLKREIEELKKNLQQERD